MTEVLLIRHGLTRWNARGLIQGHRDVALSPAGRNELTGRRVPWPYAVFDWYSSPLKRARETARLLGGARVNLDARLMELDWGRWEGFTRQELRERYAEAFAANEARGRDFRPPGGESSRELEVRLRSWLAAVASEGRSAIAVTHKGIIQMALSLATGWNLTSRAPQKLDWRCGQLFSVADSAEPLVVKELNISLETVSVGDGHEASESTTGSP